MRCAYRCVPRDAFMRCDEFRRDERESVESESEKVGECRKEVEESKMRRGVSQMPGKRRRSDDYAAKDARVPRCRAMRRILMLQCAAMICRVRRAAPRL